MQEIVIATGNKGKLAEFRQIFAELPITFLSLQDVGLGEMDVDESADTFEGNAILKAQAYAQASGKITLADDSGLCVDALDGAPGVYSARYGGENATNADRRAKLLAAMPPNAERGARFMCVIAVVNPQTGSIHTQEGVCEGTIAYAESDGQNGFGYDPLFIPTGYDLTFADLSAEVKHALSHRGLAAKALLPYLHELANSTTI
jgi:non-canonical purine NTP pyrophosphatase (RdgB/HAM1 family)